MRALYNLHKRDYWDEELLSKALFGNIQRILTPHERQIMELCIEHKTEKEIGAVMKMAPQSVRRQMYAIKKIFRTDGRHRVDDILRKALFAEEIKKRNKETKEAAK